MQKTSFQGQFWKENYRNYEIQASIQWLEPVGHYANILGDI